MTTEPDPEPKRATPILPGDYESAVVHIAWAFSRGRDVRRTMLFAWVELLPSEIPPPLDDFDPKDSHCAADGLRTIVRHAVVRADDAIRWYEGCRNGVAAVARVGGVRGFPAPGDAGYSGIDLPPVDEEVPWPALTCVSDAYTVFSFIPEWIGNPRVHHLFPRVPPDVEHLWPREEDRAAALRWIDERMHFRFSSTRELWGSIHLIAPDPVLRFMGMKHVAKDSGALNESVLLRAVPRTGRSLSGLEVYVDNLRPWGIVERRRAEDLHRVTRMDFTGELNFHTRCIVDRTRGVLRYPHAAGFIERVGFTMGLASVRRVEASRREPSRRSEPVDPSGSRPRTFDVQVVERAQEATVGAPARDRPASHRLHRLHARLTAERPRRLERWFRGDRAEARDVLRALLGRSWERARIVDAYFGPEELVDFALAVGNANGAIEILSSAKVLAKPLAKGHELELGDQLRASLDSLRAQGVRNHIEVRVMADRPEIHDRFLEIDDRVYVLGASLNEFGERGTTIIELLEPATVASEIDAVWADMRSLDAWLQHRRATRRRRSRFLFQRRRRSRCDIAHGKSGRNRW